MKKAIWTIIGILCVLIILILALPKYFSQRNQIFVQNFIESVQQNSNGKVTGKIVSETNRWFTSHSTVEFNYKFQSNSGFFKEPNVTGQFMLQLTNHYGPLLFTSNGLRLGQVFIEYALNNNTKSANYFKEPLIQGTTLIHFSGNARTDFAGLNTLTTPHFQFDGIKGTALSNDTITQLNGAVTFGQLQVNTQDSPVFTFTAKPFTQTFNLSRATTNDLWSGSKNLEFPSITIKSDDFNSQLNNVSIKSDSLVDKNFFDINLLMLIPSFTVNNESGKYQANLNLKNLNASALKEMYALTENFDPTQATEQQKKIYMSQLANKAVDLFAGKSLVQFNSTLSFDDLNNILINAGYDNTGVLGKINFSAKYLEKNNKIASIEYSLVDLNKSTIGKILHACMSASQKINSDTATDSDDIQELQTTLKQLFPQLFTSTSRMHLNIFLPEDSKTGFEFVDAKAYFNNLPKNATAIDVLTHAQLDANWKIPTYATDLLKIFGPLVISKMQGSEEQMLANNVYNIFQQMLPVLIQQGYLIQSGNYYISTWNISSKAVLMNNKSIQPLIQQLQQKTGFMPGPVMMNGTSVVPAVVEPRK